MLSSCTTLLIFKNMVSTLKKNKKIFQIETKNPLILDLICTVNRSNKNTKKNYQKNFMFGVFDVTKAFIFIEIYTTTHIFWKIKYLRYNNTYD